jgi:hypothetical protein
VENLYDEVEPYLTRARYLGASTLGGESYHHISASSGAVDWELWVHAEGDAAPRRLLLRYREIPGAPRYGLDIHQIRKLEGATEDLFAKPTSAE